MKKNRNWIRTGVIVLSASALLLGGCGAKETAAVSGAVQAPGQQDQAAQGAQAAETQASENQTETAQASEAQLSGSGDTASEPVSIEGLYQEISQEVALVSPVCMDDEFISNYYGIDPSKLEEYVFSMSEDAAHAEAVIVMRAKEASDVEELAGCLQVVVDEKKNEMENYIPEQFEIVEKSEVRTDGNYVWLVISEQADAISSIIEDSVSYN